MESTTLELLLEFALQFLSKYAIGGITVAGAIFIVVKLYIERKIKEIQKKRDEEQAEKKKQQEIRRKFEEEMYILRRQRDSLEVKWNNALYEVLIGCIEHENKPSFKKAANAHKELQKKNEEIKDAALAWEAKQKKEF